MKSQQIFAAVLILSVCQCVVLGKGGEWFFFLVWILLFFAPTNRCYLLISNSLQTCIQFKLYLFIVVIFI